MVPSTDVAVGAGSDLVIVAEDQPNLLVAKRGKLLVGVAAAARLWAAGGLVAAGADGVHFAQTFEMQRGGRGLMAVAAVLLVMAIGTLETEPLDMLLVREGDQFPERVGGLKYFDHRSLDIGMEGAHDVA